MRVERDRTYTEQSNITRWFLSDGTPEGTTEVISYLCPDLLDYASIGAADNWRGWVVRVFFWVMRAWRPKK